MKKAFIFMACIIIALFILSMLIGASGREEWTRQELYTVQRGDSLYSIAGAFGISDWRKWSYEVCELNGIEHGGMIYPGQKLIVFVGGEN